MKARMLPPEEWGRVQGEGRPPLLPYVEPRNVAVLAVEDDAGQIVASLSALQVTFLESLWFAPGQAKNPGVMRALLRLIGSLAEARGEAWLMGGADASADGTRMGSALRRLGGREIEAQFFMLPGRDRCPRE